MRSVRKSIKALLITFVSMFVVLAVYLGYTVTVNGARWFISPYNPRLGNQQQNVVAGSILDRNYVVLAKSEKPGERQYHPDSTVRKATSHTVGDPYGIAATGVESFHAQYLLGFKGNIFERLYQSIVMDQRTGDSVTTTLDSELCAYAYDKLGSNAGAIVVMNWKTGEILCSVSTPAYDPGNMDAYKGGGGSGESTLVNRVTMGQYTPGSVFKTVTLSAVVKYKPELLEKTYTCNGSYPLDDGTITCAGKATHGEQTVAQAYNNSCNICFAQIALDLGKNNMEKITRDYGFNQEFLFADLITYQSKYAT
ncbi:hypothetical protein LJC20_07540, partial [Eubacteriales bacterium OttesenSCG-928-M02]|nr:hypothetical protein [Eubacteriales bacterium OttesenSCG-928-M02]